VIDPRHIVEAMHADLDRFAGQLRRRSTRLVRESMVELRDRYARARLDSWGAASNLAAATIAADAVARLQARQAHDLGAALPTVARVSRDRQVSLLRALDERYAGSVRPLRFDTLAWLEDQSTSQIRLRQFPRSFARYGAAATAEIEDALAKLALTGRPWTEARGKVWATVRGIVGDRQWMVDRILRTETSAIYNGTALAAIEAEDTPDSPMLKRLVSIFDKVTGLDSYAQHGQLRRVREPFQDPNGRLYQAPPNRPHDRAIVVPHRSDWGERVEHLGGPRGDLAEETSAPEPLPRPPALPPARGKAKAPRKPSPAVNTAAAAVLALAGQVGDAKRVRGPLDAGPKPETTALLGELELARVRLAAARMADDARAGDGVAAGSLLAGQTLAAGGLAVRIVSASPTPAGVRVVLGIGDGRVIFDATPRMVLPLRRQVPTLRPTGVSEPLALAAVAAVLRSLASAAPQQSPAVAMR